MSHAQILAATSKAQTTLARYMGMAEGAEGNALINGVARTVVYGNPAVQLVPMDRGGYRKRYVVPATMTRDQVDAPPADKTLLTRTDLTPHITYRIDSVDTHQPLNYGLILVKLGE